MSLLVVDASVATAYVIPRQSSMAADALFRSWSRYEPIGPYVLALEMPWVLLKQERRTAEPLFARLALRRLDDLAIDILPFGDRLALQRAFDLAERSNMGFYDAIYVLLALDRKAALATRDAAQGSVARTLGVEVLDVR